MDFDYSNGSSKYSRTDMEESDGSGSSKHSSRHLEIDDDYEAGSSEHSTEGSRSSMQYSRRHLEFDVENGSSKHSSEGSGSSKDSFAYPEVINRIGGIESNDFVINPEIINGWGNKNDFEIHTGVFDESGSSKRSDVIQEEIVRFEGDIFVSTEKLRSSSSSSSSSSGSSTDDQFQADIKLSKSISGISSITFGNSSSKLEECQTGSTSKSQVSSVKHESTLTQSPPPIQVMDRLGEFGPYRIPSVVFARTKSTTPVDWSIASNESLFSIQVGNSSFSRDKILNQKSRELFKSGELKALSPSPVAPAVDKKSVEFVKSAVTVVSDDAVKDKTGAISEEPIGEKPTHPIVSWNSSAISNHSDDSGTSGCSFAFPVRKKNKSKNKNKNKKQKKKCSWPSCCCSDCSWAFCHCTWPSCYCFNCSCAFCYCSNYSCAFCYCWNCSLKRWCCYFCTILEDGRNVSKKEKAEQLQQQEKPLASALTSKSACCNCCSWFPSCRWRCHWHWCCCCNCCRGKCC